MKKATLLCLIVLIISVTVTIAAPKNPPNWSVMESLIAHYDYACKSLKISPNNMRAGYIVQLGKFQLVVVDGKKEKPYDGIGNGSIVFSPDSNRVAYMAGIRN